MKKSGPDRKYTDEFRQAAVRQVVDGGRAIRQVARSLEMSAGTLGNWVALANKGQALSKRPSSQPVGELEAEVSRLRQEVSRLKVEKEILKKAAAYFARESM
jgi:transposase